MIDDPIVIRKSRGALVVSSSIPTDPIQLVREIAEDKLEVHLKNGTKYIEDLNNADIQEIILEMMGYGVMEITFGFTAWPDGQEGTLVFVEDEEDLACIGERFIDAMFTKTPYMNSKFLSLQIVNIDEDSDIVYYDSTYSRYHVEAKLTFRARVDYKNKIENTFEKIWHPISKAFIADSRYRGVGTNDLSVHTVVIE